MSEAIRVTKATTLKPKPKDAELGFGQIFTDHMFLADFQEEKGWYDPRVEPYGPLALDPAAAVLHYAQSIFDGLKAFRGVDGKVRLFRPQKHVERMTNSAKRLCIPPLDQGLALQSIVTLVGLEREWVPKTIDDPDFPHLVYKAGRDDLCGSNRCGCRGPAQSRRDRKNVEGC